MNWLNGCALTW